MIEKLVLSVKQAAEAIGLSPWTIRKYIAEGKIKATHIGRRVLIEPSELQRLVEEGRKLWPGRPAPRGHALPLGP